MKGGSNHRPASVRGKKGAYQIPAADMPPLALPELSAAGVAQFERLLELLPPGSAARSDSIALAICAELLAEFWRSPVEFSANRLNPLRGLLAEFGLTLAARRRLEIAPVEPANPFAAIRRKSGPHEAQIPKSTVADVISSTVRNRTVELPSVVVEKGEVVQCTTSTGSATGKGDRGEPPHG